MTPAALRALLEGNFENFAVASTPGGIEAQEKRGQISFVKDQTLPKKIIGEGDYTTLDKLGFVMGPDFDDIFFSCEFPEGWSKVPTEHNIHSHVIDDEARIRIRVFYKAAFYDRNAHMSFVRRYSYGYYPCDFYKTDISYAERQEGLWYGVVLDQGLPIYTTKGFYDRENKQDGLENEAHFWIIEHYPDFGNILAYWDE